MISIPAACPVVAKRGSEVMPVATCGFAAALCVLMLAYRRKDTASWDSEGRCHDDDDGDGSASPSSRDDSFDSSGCSGW